MTPREVLLAAAVLVEHGWTQGAGARGRSGKSVLPLGRSAVCWCAIGAIMRAGDRDCDQMKAAEETLLSLLPDHETIAEWNDAPERTQDEVAIMLRLAAKVGANR